MQDTSLRDVRRIFHHHLNVSNTMHALLVIHFRFKPNDFIEAKKCRFPPKIQKMYGTQPVTFSQFFEIFKPCQDPSRTPKILRNVSNIQVLLHLAIHATWRPQKNDNPGDCKFFPYAKPPPLGNRSSSPDFQESAGPKQHEAWDQPVDDGDADDAAVVVAAGGGNCGHCYHYHYCMSWPACKLS